MWSLTLSRGEKLSPHSVKRPLDSFRAIVKSTRRPCAGRKAERGGSWKRDFLILTFRPGLSSSFSLRDRSLPHRLTRHWSSERMNEWTVYAISGTSWLPWMGAALSRSDPGKKGQPAGFSRSIGSREWGNTSVPLSTRGPELRERERPRALSPNFLTPLTTFYLKFNLKWGPSWQISEI